MLSDSQGTMDFCGSEIQIGWWSSRGKGSYTCSWEHEGASIPQLFLISMNTTLAWVWQPWWLAHCVFMRDFVPIIRVIYWPLSREKLGILSYRLVLRGWILANPLISCCRIKMPVFQIQLECDKNCLWVTSVPCKSITFLILSDSNLWGFSLFWGEIWSSLRILSMTAQA